MNDHDLTKLRNDVIEAAKEACYAERLPALRSAVDALLAAEQPQPVECLMTRFEKSNVGPDGWCYAYASDYPVDTIPAGEVWQGTWIPGKRVR